MENKTYALNIFRNICTIVHCENKIISHYNEDAMKTPMHMSMGDENSVCGVVECLKDDSYFFGYYRTHSLYLSLTQDTHKFFSEMHGRKNGSNFGIAGSMHMSSNKNSLIATSAIVSSTVPLSLGAAFSCLRLKKKKFSTVFFGDGALEEGVFHESLNIACLMKLPIIFVCLDNDLAVDIPSNERRGFKSIKDFINSYKCGYFYSKYSSGLDVFEVTRKAKTYIEKNNSPVFLHLDYYRYLQHIGIQNDFESGVGEFEKKGYRSKDEFIYHNKVGPIDKIASSMLDLGFKKDDLKKISHEISNEVDISYDLSLTDEFPNSEDLYNNLYPD